MEVELIQRLARGRGASPVQLRGGEKKKAVLFEDGAACK